MDEQLTVREASEDPLEADFGGRFIGNDIVGGLEIRERDNAGARLFSSKYVDVEDYR